MNDEWSVKHVWNYEQLMENKNEIQMSLLYHLLRDRSQELVSKPVINVVLINYCVNYFRRHREYWRRRYLINFQMIDYISKLVY